MAANLDLERVAETHFLLRPVLVNALRAQEITDAGRAYFKSGAANYYELWVETLADRWFDMASLTRLGTAVETGLRDAYESGSGRRAPASGIFQRLVDDSDLTNMFKADCGIDLAANAEWRTMRTVMLHRHLYAHRSGAVDEKYLKDHIAVTGSDISPDVKAHGYPQQQVYWFRPLENLDAYIEASRRFLRSLP